MRRLDVVLWPSMAEAAEADILALDEEAAPWPRLFEGEADDAILDLGVRLSPSNGGEDSGILDLGVEQRPWLDP